MGAETGYQVKDSGLTITQLPPELLGGTVVEKQSNRGIYIDLSFINDALSWLGFGTDDKTANTCGNLGIGGIETLLLQGAGLSQSTTLLATITIALTKEGVDCNFGKPQKEGEQGYFDWGDAAKYIGGWLIVNWIQNAAHR
jgi:hypothetical protein